ncbi:MAG: glycerophosphodiester phosphodiesterase [Woeseiaceae bacterium]|jgi:glycerophosphoryl diester phosphodiesterase
MTLVIAHRGASGYLPEHTLAAKTLAFEMGADFLEQDLVASRDDELIVVHDVHLDRVSDVATRFPGRHRDDGRYYVRDFDLEEIRTLSAWERMNADGSPVYPGRYAPRSGDFGFNTLTEELEHVKALNAKHGRNVGVYPEIKRPAWHRNEGVDMTPMVIDVLNQFGYEERLNEVFVQCFDDAEIRRLREECPYKLVQLVGMNAWGESATDYEAMWTPEGIRRVAESADGVGPHMSHLASLDPVDSVPLVSGMAQVVRDAGLVCHPYTFRADEIPPGFASFEDLVEFFVNDVGVDGLFTDFPDRVIALLGK